jgi:ABC-type Na+ transport system ATPase subunit NatA
MTSFAEDVCDVIAILNEGEIVTQGPPQNIIEAAGARNLEDAYLNIVGGKIDREALLAWR